MFGRNEVAARMHYTGRWDVQDVFHTIQGEGPLTGVPAVFVRLARCNLRCTFCDTDFTSNIVSMSTDELLDGINACRQRAPTTRLVVITGGEPMLQELGMLVPDIITKLHMAVQIETAGTVWPASFDAPLMREYLDREDLFTIVCSPKTPRVHGSVEKHCRHWKYIIRAEGNVSPDDGLPTSSTQPVGPVAATLFRPKERTHGDPRRAVIWIQPCEEYATTSIQVLGPGAESRVLGHMEEKDKALSEVAVKRAVRIVMQYGYRLSLQTHKMVGLP